MDDCAFKTSSQRDRYQSTIKELAVITERQLLTTLRAAVVWTGYSERQSTSGAALVPFSSVYFDMMEKQICNSYNFQFGGSATDYSHRFSPALLHNNCHLKEHRKAMRGPLRIKDI